MRCDGIFRQYYCKFFFYSSSEINVKIGQYLMKLRRTKKVCQFFGPPCTSRLFSAGAETPAYVHVVAKLEANR